jgi:ribosomal protein S18 acetylase RimI-like enzyme
VAVTMRAMHEGEFPEYLRRARESYARQVVEYGGFPPEWAETKVDSDFEALLPEGLATPDLDVLVVEEDGTCVGHAVIGLRNREARTYVFVYDVEIDVDHRGRGLGRAVMELIEERARAEGVEAIELNVFGGNAVARALYRSLGYEEAAVTMVKRV